MHVRQVHKVTRLWSLDLPRGDVAVRAEKSSLNDSVPPVGFIYLPSAKTVPAAGVIILGECRCCRYKPSDSRIRSVHEEAPSVPGGRAVVCCFAGSGIEKRCRRLALHHETNKSSNIGK